MALTTAGTALTEAHRVAQVRTAAATLADIVSAWRLLDPARLDATSPIYARVAAAIIAGRRAESSNTAAAYLRAFRSAEGVPGVLDVALAGELPAELVATTIRVTGPVAIKAGTAAGGKPFSAITDAALSETAASGIRLVLAGGRDTVQRTIARDPAALGYARVTDGSPCAFCAMLAGRGPVYKAGTSRFRAHKRCGCTAEPVYGRAGYRWPGGDRSRAWADLYDTHAKGQPDALAAFRAAYHATGS